jgi:Flp pilus assembly pilin Flp
MRRRGFMEALRRRPITERRQRRDEGVTLVEYGLIVAGIVIVSMGAIAALTTAVGSQYGRTSADVGSPQVIAAPASAVPGLTCTGTSVANHAGTACVTIAVLCAEEGGIPNQSGKGCVPNQAAYCVQVGQVINHAGTGCVLDQAAFCAEVSQIPNHAGSGCVANQTAFCAEVGQLVNHAGDGCVTQTDYCLEAGQVANHAGTGCVTPAAFCAEVGKWFNSGTGNCDTKAICIGQQTFNDTNNTCAPPTCTAAQWYNATTGNCDSKTTCTANQWFNGTTNACDAKAVCIGAQTYNSTTNTCTPPACTGQWYNSATGNCDAIPACIGAQTYNSTTNTCTPPTCTGGKDYNPTTGNCVTVTLAPTGSVSRGATYRSTNVIGRTETMTSTVITSQPPTAPAGTVSFSGRRISYVAGGTAGTAVILFTYTSGGNTLYGTLTITIT